ncbi:MAG: M23 family metallopeptidase [Gemmatimonadota bacterium]
MPIRGRPALRGALAIAARAGCALGIVALAGCAGAAAERMPPGAGAARPTAPPAATSDSARRDAEPREGQRATIVARVASAALPSPTPIELSLPAIRPFGIRWTPAAPAEGTAVGVWLFEPAGRRVAQAVEGSLDGRPVRFARLGSGWFGVAPIPIGLSGPVELSLRIGVAADSAVEQRTTIHVRSRTFPATRLRVDPRFSSPTPEALERIKRERARVRETLARVTPEWLIEGGFRWPRRGRINSPYGQRRVFNGELRSRHMGVDLAGRAGDPVRAAARGRVALADHLYFAGGAVYLDHGVGLYTGYFHLSRILVQEGDLVEAGDVIGEVGATGRVTAPHLHWSLYVAGQSLDAGSLLEIEVPPVAPATPEE